MTDLRTHPPLQFTFPPKPSDAGLKHESDPDRSQSSSADKTESRLDNVSDRFVREDKVRQARPRGKHDKAEVSKDDRWLTMRSLVTKSSKFVVLDGARTTGFSPSVRAAFSTTSPAPNVPRQLEEPPQVPAAGRDKAFNARVASWAKLRLPNHVMKFDLRSLNLHLACRVAEVLACSEAMWEWVLEYQAKADDAKRLAANRSVPISKTNVTDISAPRSSSVQPPESTPSAGGFHNQLVDMSREEFDILLFRFDM